MGHAVLDDVFECSAGGCDIFVLVEHVAGRSGSRHGYVDAW